MHALAIEGTFDDCQAMVKGMFNHARLRDELQLSGVNSINWARIAAQAVYYFTAAVALGSPDRRVSFSVPTGNFGDILAGWVAKRMGLPIERLMIATNANDILARTLETGAYEIRGVQPTDSPSMDIQISSNFERLLFEAYERDAGAVRAAYGGPCAIRVLHHRRRTARADPGRIHGARRWTRTSVADEMARDLSGDRLCARSAQRRRHPRRPRACCRTIRNVPVVALATAHPAKFPDAVERATGVRPALPPHMADLMEPARRASRFCPTIRKRSSASSASARGRSGRRRMNQHFVREDGSTSPG